LSEITQDTRFCPCKGRCDDGLYLSYHRNAVLCSHIPFPFRLLQMAFRISHSL